jgi:hypothetical protein
MAQLETMLETMRRRQSLWLAVDATTLAAPALTAFLIFLGWASNSGTPLLRTNVSKSIREFMARGGSMVLLVGPSAGAGWRPGDHVVKNPRGAGKVAFSTLLRYFVVRDARPLYRDWPLLITFLGDGGWAAAQAPVRARVRDVVSRCLASLSLSPAAIDAIADLALNHLVKPSITLLGNDGDNWEDVRHAWQEVFQEAQGAGESLRTRVVEKIRGIAFWQAVAASHQVGPALAQAVDGTDEAAIVSVARLLLRPTRSRPSTPVLLMPTRPAFPCVDGLLGLLRRPAIQSIDEVTTTLDVALPTTALGQADAYLRRSLGTQLTRELVGAVVADDPEWLAPRAGVESAVRLILHASMSSGPAPRWDELASAVLGPQRPWVAVLCHGGPDGGGEEDDRKKCLRCVAVDLVGSLPAWRATVRGSTLNGLQHALDRAFAVSVTPGHGAAPASCCGSSDEAKYVRLAAEVALARACTWLCRTRGVDGGDETVLQLLAALLADRGNLSLKAAMDHAAGPPWRECEALVVGATLSPGDGRHVAPLSQATVGRLVAALSCTPGNHVVRLAGELVAGGVRAVTGFKKQAKWLRGVWEVAFAEAAGRREATEQVSAALAWAADVFTPPPAVVRHLNALAAGPPWPMVNVAMGAAYMRTCVVNATTGVATRGGPSCPPGSLCLTLPATMERLLVGPHSLRLYWLRLLLQHAGGDSSVAHLHCVTWTSEAGQSQVVVVAGEAAGANWAWLQKFLAARQEGLDAAVYAVPGYREKRSATDDWIAAVLEEAGCRGDPRAMDAARRLALRVEVAPLAGMAVYLLGCMMGGRSPFAQLATERRDVVASLV